MLVKDYQLNGPNDVWVHPNGDIYFTDPYYERSYWTEKQEQKEDERVYLLSKNRGLIPIITNLEKPNGIIGSNDGKHLYVADIKGNKTYKYAINKDGSLGAGEVIVEMGSDGMTLDSKGNLYLTGNGVTVFNPAGKQIEHIPVPAKWTANVTFGGKNFDYLFITASEAVYTLQMQVTSQSILI